MSPSYLVKSKPSSSLKQGLAMERLFHIANSYHRITHCCPWSVILKRRLIYIYFLSYITFPTCFILSILLNKNPAYYIPILILLFISEGVFIFGPDAIRTHRDDYIKEKFKNRFKRDFHSIDDVKKLVLNRHFKRAERNYGYLVDHIKKSIEGYKEKPRAMDIIDFALKFTPTPSSISAKTLTALIPLIASIASIYYGIDKKDLTELIKNPSENTIAIVFLAIFAFYIALTIVAFIVHSSPLFFDRLFSALRKRRNHHNFYTLKSLQHDLLLYSRIPAPKAEKA